MKIKKLLLSVIISVLILYSPFSAIAENPEAYDYLRYINDNYPDRVFSEGKSYAAGDYIINTLEGFGYLPVVESFDTHDFYCDIDDYALATGRNISIDIKGQTEKMILLGAHYDCADTKGCDDNASGVAVALSLAKKLFGTTPPCSIRIVFFDDEEDGYIGSGMYCKNRPQSFFDNLLFMINIDSIAGGDNLYIHGGYPDGSYTFARDYALSRSADLGLDFGLHPEVSGIPAGTRFGGSDHVYFGRRFIPYIYIEANVYSDASEDGRPFHYQTENAAIENHQIMHTANDDMDIIEAVFPGRIAEHLNSVLLLCEDILLHTDTDGSYSPDGISHIPYTPSDDQTVISGLSADFTGTANIGSSVLASDFDLKVLYSDGSSGTPSFYTCDGIGEVLTDKDNIITFYYMGFKAEYTISFQETSTEEVTEEAMEKETTEEASEDETSEQEITETENPVEETTVEETTIEETTIEETTIEETTIIETDIYETTENEAVDEGSKYSAFPIIITLEAKYYRISLSRMPFPYISYQAVFIL